MSHEFDEDMSESISAETLQQLIAGYVLYDLSPEEAARLQRLRDQDPAIAQSIEQMQTLLESAYTPPSVLPDSRLRDTLLQAHQALAPTVPLASSIASPLNADSPLPLTNQSSRLRWNGWQAVAAAVIVGLGISNLVTWRSLQLARTPMPSTESVTVALTPTEVASDSASVTVTINPDQLQGTLTIEQLPPLEEDQVYALWTVLQPDAPFTTDDKDAILTEVVTDDDLGTTSLQILLPPVYRDREWIRAIAITVEAANAPQQHVASPILFTAL